MPIYQKDADTREEIAALLRRHNEVIIHSSLKTESVDELLKFAEEKNKWGRFIVICTSRDAQLEILRLTLAPFQIKNQVDFCRDKLLGRPASWGEQPTPPLTLIASQHMQYINQGGWPVFVAGWDGLTEEQKRVVLATGRFAAAVTSITEE